MLLDNLSGCRSLGWPSIYTKDIIQYMFDSFFDTLQPFLDTTSHASIAYLEGFRLDVEDFIYLCNIDTKWYVVYRTDFIDNLPYNTRMIEDWAAKERIQLTNWLVINKYREQYGSRLPFKAALKDDESIRSALVLIDQKSKMRTAVIEADGTNLPHMSLRTPGYGGI